MNFAKKDTAKTFLVGPILDSAGAAKTDEVVGSINVTKNGTVAGADAQDTLTHDHTGHYKLVSDGGDFSTVGEVEFSLNSGTNAMAPVKFQVLPVAIYDSFVSGTATADGLVLGSAAYKLAVDSAGKVAVPDTQKVDVNTIKTVAVEATATVTFANGTVATTGGAVASVANIPVDGTLKVDVTNWKTATAPAMTGDAYAQINTKIPQIITMAQIGGTGVYYVEALNSAGAVIGTSTYAGADTAGTTELLTRVPDATAGETGGLALVGSKMKLTETWS